MNKEDFIKKPVFLGLFSCAAVFAASLVFYQKALSEIAAIGSLRDASSLEERVPLLILFLGIALAVFSGFIVYLLQKRHIGIKRRESALLERISLLFEEAPFLFWIRNGDEIIHANREAKKIAGEKIEKFAALSDISGDSPLKGEDDNYTVSFSHKEIGKNMRLGVGTAKKINRDGESGTVSLSAVRHMAEVLRSLRWHLESLLRGNAGKLPKKATAIIRENFESHLAMIALAEKIASLEDKEEERTAITLGNLIKSEAIDFKLFAQTRNVSFRFSIPEEELPTLMLPREKFRVILRELIDNAIRYNKPGGEIHIEVKSRPADIEISIKDSGAGIPSHEQPAIFKSPLHNKERKTGGMGLFVANHHAQSLGGTLGYSTGPEGTELLLVLPALSLQVAAAGKEN